MELYTPEMYEGVLLTTHLLDLSFIFQSFPDLSTQSFWRSRFHREGLPLPGYDTTANSVHDWIDLIWVSRLLRDGSPVPAESLSPGGWEDLRIIADGGVITKANRIYLLAHEMARCWGDDPVSVLTLYSHDLANIKDPTIIEVGNVREGYMFIGSARESPTLNISVLMGQNPHGIIYAFTRGKGDPDPDPDPGRNYKISRENLWFLYYKLLYFKVLDYGKLFNSLLQSAPL